MQKRNESTKGARGLTVKLATSSLKKIANILIRYKYHIAVILSYFLLSVIFTYPVAFSVSNIPGGGDAFFYLWDIWWFSKSLLNLSSPFFTSYLLHPTGLSLASSAITPFNAILSVPLQMVFGIIGAYNILFIISFIFAGYGTYLLVDHIVGDRRAAFLSGLIFMFSPYHFSHALGHLNLMAIEWIPFFILFLIKTANENKTSNVIYASIFLLLTSLCDLTYGVFVLSFTALYILFIAYNNRQNMLKNGVLQRIALMLSIFGILILPFILPLLLEMLTSKDMYSGGFVTYSADLIGFFIPAQFNPIFEGMVSPIYGNFTGNVSEYTVFAGYVAILLSAYAIIKIRTKDIWFWVLSTLVFFILCLGPRLHINGTVTNIILPYEILTHIPIIAMARAPGRWDSMVMLCIAVLAGYGSAYIFTRVKDNHSFLFSKKNALLLCLSIIVLLEFLAIPFPDSQIAIPSFYHQLANDTNNYAIYEIPDYGYHLAFPEYMYYQTLHQKELITGYTHIPESAMEFTENTPFVRDLYFYYLNPDKSPNPSDILDQNVSQVAPSILDYYNIHYIMLHKQYMTDSQYTYDNLLLMEALGNRSVYEDSNMTVFEVPQTSISPFMAIGQRWYDIENLDNISTRWCINNATIMIYSPNNTTKDLSFSILSFYQPRLLQVYDNDKMEYDQTVPARFENLSITINLTKGENIISFGSTIPPHRPIDIKGLNSSDTRALSFAVRDIALD